MFVAVVLYIIGVRCISPLRNSRRQGMGPHLIVSQRHHRQAKVKGGHLEGGHGREPIANDAEEGVVPKPSLL